ncbi:coilin isoform X2 [Nicotiana tomentosiformis]|uniref:coilin isoform X2 n=1 Tax=Nicotiana tomentosiformis TaxID=4098 RepID=UPI00051C5995|nr:coilin isoform X2 [Nicotiana tomentosiformis]
MEGVRLRLLFKDPDILSDLQKTEGFKRIWFLLKPQLHTTINDLSSYLLRTFQLHASCPHGIMLSMDGFVLPPFESTYILKDKDVVSVEKKGGHLAVDGNNGQKVILAVEGNDGPNAIENLQIVEKQPEIDGPLLLANEAFGHESSDSEDESSDSEETEDNSEKEEEAEPKEDTSHRENATISKKRKASETLPCSKKKKHCSDVKKKLDEQTKKQQDLTSKKQNRSDTKNKDMENNRGNAESSEDNPITPSTKKNDEVQKSSVENIETTPNSDATKKKGPSRTARRKKAKRQWLREMAKIQEKNTLVESEGLRNWKELQAEAGRGEPSRQPEGRVNDEANGQPKGHRNWKQQKTKAKKEEATGQPKGLLHWKQFHGEDQNRDTDQEKHAEETSKSSGKSCQNIDTEDEVVPVEIRPGHIRFEPLGKELVSKQSQVEVESFRWNGMMSKKKGQKWGQEKVSFSQRNDSPGSNKERPGMMNCERQRWGQEKVSFSQNNDSLEMMNCERQKWGQEKVSFSHNDSLGSRKGHPEMMNRERQKWGQEKVSFPQNNDSLGSNKEHPEMLNGEKEPHCHESIDFNTLPFLSGVPKEGLVIAYRLLELSSTWTPEVSSYRVGKISWCNSEANRVLLMPVAEFPVIFSEDESSKQPDSSIYNENGSLEIDFSALLEVRLLKNGTPDSAGVPGRVIEGSAANGSTPVIGSSKKKTETPSAEVNNGKKTQSTPSGNGRVNLWEQFSETLKAKKTELSQEGSWGKPSSGKNSWSYRSMRGGALGPTMAILRSQNKI